MRIPMPNVFVNWIIRRAQRTPYFHLPAYMERWWLRRPPKHGAQDDVSETRRTGWGIRVHHTMASDNDRALHDHPWSNISIVLRGGYWELMGDGNYVWRAPGSIVVRRAADKHRLIIPKGSTCWSLFFMGRWQRDWGFWPSWGWTYWRDYLGGDLDDSIHDSILLKGARTLGSDHLYKLLRERYADEGVQYLCQMTSEQRGYFERYVIACMDADSEA